MQFLKAALLGCAGLAASAVATSSTAQEVELASAAGVDEIIITGALTQSRSATKTATSPLEVPQPVTVVTDDLFEAQGAISISDTLRYVAGVQANPYGPDGRVDSGFIRGIQPLQFRDGMRDIFSFYASIRADPYNFSQVEVLRGPSSVLFGAGSIGGLVNLVSKTPSFTNSGEIKLLYGSHDRKEVMADFTGPIAGDVAGRIVGRLRDSDTQTDYVEDDRVLISPSVSWQPTPDTNLTFIGLYQEDDGGSTSQFLPLVGTLLENPNGQLDDDLFIGKPGWDRYDGRLLQGTGLFEQRLGDVAALSLKARYIDSDLTYLTHYPNSYSNPTDPYLDDDQRIIGNYASGSLATLNVFSTDNNLRFDFQTGSAVEHVVLAGVDYSWSEVKKEDGLALEPIDIYDIDYSSLSDFGGDIPRPGDPGFLSASSEDTVTKQLGFYLQDQIRLWERVSIVLGVRHDNAEGENAGVEAYDSDATSFRAGIIGEVVRGISPFFSYTESFEPIAGATSDGSAFVPKEGRQFEAGVKIHPAETTLVTATAFHIKESNRPVSDDSTPDPTDQIQAGELTSQGFELEARHSFPGDLTLIANYAYVDAEIEDVGTQLDNVAEHTASAWAMKQFGLADGYELTIGAGGRYTGESRSYGFAFPDGVVTPDYFLVDALVAVRKENWELSVNATNLLDNDYYANCLARGDCFIGTDRNIFATLSFAY